MIFRIMSTFISRGNTSAHNEMDQGRASSVKYLTQSLSEGIAKEPVFSSRCMTFLPRTNSFRDKYAILKSVFLFHQFVTKTSLLTSCLIKILNLICKLLLPLPFKFERERPASQILVVLLPLSGNFGKETWISNISRKQFFPCPAAGKRRNRGAALGVRAPKILRKTKKCSLYTQRVALFLMKKCPYSAASSPSLR